MQQTLIFIFTLFLTGCAAFTGNPTLRQSANSDLGKAIESSREQCYNSIIARENRLAAEVRSRSPLLRHEALTFEQQLILQQNESMGRMVIALLEQTVQLAPAPCAQLGVYEYRIARTAETQKTIRQLGGLGLKTLGVYGLASQGRRLVLGAIREAEPNINTGSGSTVNVGDSNDVDNRTFEGVCQGDIDPVTGHCFSPPLPDEVILEIMSEP